MDGLFSWCGGERVAFRTNTVRYVQPSAGVRELVAAKKGTTCARSSATHKTAECLYNIVVGSLQQTNEHKAIAKSIEIYGRKVRTAYIGPLRT